MDRKFKVGSIIRKKNPTRFDFILEVVRIDNGYYLADVVGRFSSETIPFEDEDKYELVKREAKYSSHVRAMSKKKNDFAPAKGVTMSNSLRYIVAVEEAAIKEYDSIEPHLRTAALQAVKGALSLAVATIDRLIKQDQREKADPKDLMN